MAFYVGQKVVCVDDKPRHYPRCSLTKGRIYTITGSSGEGEFLAVTVAEAKSYGLTRGFYPDRFRPIVERKTETGMAILKKLLVTEKEKV